MCCAGLHRLPSIRIFTTKQKSGVVERISDGESGSMVTVIGKGMFKPETDMSRFLGMPVGTEDGAVRLWLAAVGQPYVTCGGCALPHPGWRVGVVVWEKWQVQSALS